MVCEKRKFWTRQAAVSFAASVRKGRGGGRKQRAYLCSDPECREAGFWHLTSMSTEHVTYYREHDRSRREARARAKASQQRKRKGKQ